MIYYFELYMHHNYCLWQKQHFKGRPTIERRYDTAVRFIVFNLWRSPDGHFLIADAGTIYCFSKK